MENGSVTENKTTLDNRFRTFIKTTIGTINENGIDMSDYTELSKVKKMTVLVSVFKIVKNSFKYKIDMNPSTVDTIFNKFRVYCVEIEEYSYASVFRDIPLNFDKIETIKPTAKSRVKKLEIKKDQ